MEIFVNRRESDHESLNEFVGRLEGLGYKFDPAGENANYLVIDNEDKVYWFEGDIRADRNNGHYLVITSVDTIEAVLKMVRNESFARANTGKPEWSLMDIDSFEVMIRVLEAGAKKYDRDNWKKGKPTKAELLKLWDCAFRHTKDIKKGIETGDPAHIYDKDLGINHIGNAMCNLMFLSYHLIQGGKQEIFNPNK
jgi:hypothetical protein